MVYPIVIFAALCQDCRGSSAVEQGTHKPLVASSNLALGTKKPAVSGFLLPGAWYHWEKAFPLRPGQTCLQSIKFDYLTQWFWDADPGTARQGR